MIANVTQDKAQAFNIESPSFAKRTTIDQIGQIFSLRVPNPRSIPSEHYDYKAFDTRFRSLLEQVPIHTQLEAVERILKHVLLQESEGSIMDLQTALDLKILPAGESYSPDELQEAQEANRCVSRHVDDKFLADELDRTFTHLGRFYFDYLLTNPTNNAITIYSRQAVAKAFAESSLRLSLETLFEDLQRNEEHVLGFFAERPVVVAGRFRHLRFTAGGDAFNKTVNQYSPVVTLSAALKTTEAGLAAILKVGAAIALPLYALSLTGVMSETSKESLENFADRTVASSGTLNALVQYLGNPLLKGGVALAAVAVSASSINSSFGFFLADLHIESYVQNKLVVVAHYFRSLERIYELLASNEEITTHLKHFDKLTAFMKNKQLQYLFYLLRSSTFDSKASCMFCRGPVVIGWELMSSDTVKVEFEKAFLAIAEIEALLSIARLKVESQQEGARSFCFAEYVVSETGNTPFIKVENLSNPVIPFHLGDSTDTLFLGIKTAQNLLITAPNTSGKSTKMRSLAYLAALQGLGIAPAKAAQLSIFDWIVTSKGLTDNNEQSLHQAYLSFSADLIKKIDANPEKKVLVLLDEAFTTTESHDGAAFLMGLLDLLQDKKNTMVVVASHFKELIDSLKGYSSYTIDESSRKLVPGFFEGSNAFVLAEKMGINQALIDKARAFRQSIGHAS